MNLSNEKRRTARKTFKRSIFLEKVSLELNRAKNIRRSGAGLDISDGGLGLNSKFTLKIGEILKLSIPLLTSGISVPVFAQVRWVHPINRHFRTGLRFL
jgi:Tfp pilus assembly protein PilZ